MNVSTADSQSGMGSRIEYRYELVRKSIHLSSLSIPIIYFYISRNLALTVLIPLTAAFLTGDLLRIYHKPSFELYRRTFGKMLRRHELMSEKKTFNGATWVLISATFCVAFFPKIIAITAFAILIISDTVAALIGIRFGTKRFRGKSLEGSAAFLVSAMIVICVTPKVAFLPGEYFIAVLAAVVGMIAEVFSFDLVDDNLAIPIAIGYTLWGLYALWFPSLNLFLLQ